MMEAGGADPSRLDCSKDQLPEGTKHMGRWVDSPGHLGKDCCARGQGETVCVKETHPTDLVIS